MNGRVQTFGIERAHSQAVKHDARQVLTELQPNIYHSETPCTTREVLKLELGGIDRGRLPPLFGSMLDCLLLDGQLESSPVFAPGRFCNRAAWQLGFRADDESWAGISTGHSVRSPRGIWLCCLVRSLDQ